MCIFSGLLFIKLKLCFGLFNCGEEMFRFNKMSLICFVNLCWVMICFRLVKEVWMILKWVFDLVSFVLVWMVLGFLFKLIRLLFVDKCVNIWNEWLFWLKVVLMYILDRFVIKVFIVLLRSMVLCFNFWIFIIVLKIVWIWEVF